MYIIKLRIMETPIHQKHGHILQDQVRHIRVMEVHNL